MHTNRVSIVLLSARGGCEITSSPCRTLNLLLYMGMWREGGAGAIRCCQYVLFPAGAGTGPARGVELRQAEAVTGLWRSVAGPWRFVSGSLAICDWILLNCDGTLPISDWILGLVFGDVCLELSDF